MRLRTFLVFIVTGTIYLVFAVPGVRSASPQPESGEAKDSAQGLSPAEMAESLQSPPYLPVYRVKLRVHLAGSGRAPQEFIPIFDEINDIWWSQAGICFEIEAVGHDKTLADGLDMWFSPYIGGLNGYYDGYDIQMTDDPALQPAANPAMYSAARTAAHELGHALGLPHRQESDDNLMRSKTYGWQLSNEEIEAARGVAAKIAESDTTPIRCMPPQFKFVEKRFVKQSVRK